MPTRPASFGGEGGLDFAGGVGHGFWRLGAVFLYGCAGFLGVVSRSFYYNDGVRRKL